MPTKLKVKKTKTKLAHPLQKVYVYTQYTAPKGQDTTQLKKPT